jgi:hypothetical protein
MISQEAVESPMIAMILDGGSVQLVDAIAATCAFRHSSLGTN